MLLRTAVFAAALCGGASHAQTPSRAGEFEQGYGVGGGGLEQPIEAGSRDANGNRVVLNGRILQGQTTLSGGLMDGDGAYGAASAIGNQLNVITQGSWNTVIIESTQTNTGDVNAAATGGRS